MVKPISYILVIEYLSWVTSNWALGLVLCISTWKLKVTEITKYFLEKRENREKENNCYELLFI